MNPLIIGFAVDLLTELGVGGSIVVALVLGFVAYEGYRVLAVGRRAGGLLSNAVWYFIIIVGAVAAVIALGWASPNVGEFLGDVTAWGGMLLEWVTRMAEGVLTG